jgi:hypothetical protein
MAELLMKDLARRRDDPVRREYSYILDIPTSTILCGDFFKLIRRVGLPPFLARAHG